MIKYFANLIYNSALDGSFIEDINWKRGWSFSYHHLKSLKSSFVKRKRLASYRLAAWTSIPLCSLSLSILISDLAFLDSAIPLIVASIIPLGLAIKGVRVSSQDPALRAIDFVSTADLFFIERKAKEIGFKYVSDYLERMRTHQRDNLTRIEFDMLARMVREHEKVVTSKNVKSIYTQKVS